MTPLERMCEAYWNAFRDGFLRVGGDPKYPTWAQSNDPVKQETMRCMRHAVETLEGVIPEFQDVFPDGPSPRRAGTPRKTEKAFARKVTP